MKPNVVILELTEDERERIIREARDEVVRRIMEEDGSRLRCLSQPQVCGILNCSIATLEGYGIPRISTGNRSVLYRMSDVADFIEKRVAKPK